MRATELVRNREHCQGALALCPSPGPVAGYLGLHRERAEPARGPVPRPGNQNLLLGTKSSAVL